MPQNVQKYDFFFDFQSDFFAWILLNFMFISLIFSVLEFRAVDGIRTRDPQLGKLMLYQLSYYRIQSVLVLSYVVAFQAFYCAF